MSGPSEKGKARLPSRTEQTPHSNTQQARAVVILPTSGNNVLLESFAQTD
jgi:hypothetical protein